MNRLARAIGHPRRSVERAIEIVSGFLPQSESRVASDAFSFWAGSDSTDGARDLSHWLGEGRWSDQGAWTHIGQLHFEMFESLCLLANRERPVRSMVEWGPGGGANAVRFCAEAAGLYGVDISAPNLAECRRQLEIRGFDGFQPILIDTMCPEQCLQFVKSPVEFFLSTAVYQHFPSKQYGIRVTELACELLADDGVALIQIRYHDGSKRFAPKNRDYWRNVVTFTSYGISEFWQIAVESGFNPLAVSLDPDINYAYYFLKKRKTDA